MPFQRIRLLSISASGKAVLFALLLVAFIATALVPSHPLATVAAQDFEAEDFDEDEFEFEEEEFEEDDDDRFDARDELRENREVLAEVQDELREARQTGNTAETRLLETRLRHLEADRELLSKIADVARLRENARAEDEEERVEEFDEILDSWIEQREQAQHIGELDLGLLELDVLADEAKNDAQKRAHLPRIEKVRGAHKELVIVTQKLSRAVNDLRSAEREIEELEQLYDELEEEVEAQWEQLEYVMEHNSDADADAEAEHEADDEPNGVSHLSLDDAPFFTFEQSQNTLTEYCFDCHAGEAPEANLDLEELLTHKPLVRDRDTWRRVMQLLELGAMPPEDMSQPTTDERLGLLAFFDREIDKFDYSQIDDPGFEPARRLTHQQYNNTIRDLLGVDLRPAERFPSELAGANGFDNSANTLFLQSSLMERYVAAAERVIEVALPPEVTTVAHRRTRDLIFVATPSDSLSDDEAAIRVLSRFLMRAYRRVPTDGELSAVTGFYRQHRQHGSTFEQAVISALPAVLVSPKFLLRIEAGQDTEQAYRVNDWELASRLSYFLWSSMPDNELFALAESGKLDEPAVLDAQVLRMLADPRADSLGEIFAAQWLSTRLVGTRIRLDPIDNPWCTDSLMAAMRDETSLFFISLLRENRAVSELIDADYTFMNEELARTLYHRKDIRGQQMRRVSLKDPNRGGILTQPSVLTVTSSYKRTSPIKRGVYILDTVLGTPPPPPPPGAGELDEQLRESDHLSFREKLELHSKNASCRACHARIDPMGFTMENFDYFGRWREEYRRRKQIDATSTLPDGTKITGPTGVKRLILEKRHDELVRQMVVKMLAFALGRQVDYYDEPSVQKIIERLEQDDFRFQTLLKEVAKSYPFQYRKHGQEEPRS